jgi:hypothetical protein
MSEIDYLRLRDALAAPAHAGLSDAAAAEALMQPETVWVDVPIAALESHCRRNLILSTLAERVAEAAPGLARRVAQELLGMIGGKLSMIEMSKQATREDVLAMLGGLQAAEWLSADEVTGIRALGQEQRPKCAALGWSAVSEHDVAHARGIV